MHSHHAYMYTDAVTLTKRTSFLLLIYTVHVHCSTCAHIIKGGSVCKGRGEGNIRVVKSHHLNPG